MRLYLAKLPAIFAERGIYGATKNRLPGRAALLHPAAARSLVLLEQNRPGVFHYSDVFRTPESSLRARREGRGAQPPAYSAHNYGLAVDVDIDGTCRRGGFSYSKLLEVMSSYGWHCHRRDGKGGHEAWHFNYLAPDEGSYLRYCTTRAKTWARAVEVRILDFYGHQMSLSATEAQEALAKLSLYGGDIDGDFGPRSREALKAFQRTWSMKATGELDARSQRVLAYVTAEKVVEDLPGG